MRKNFNGLFELPQLIYMLGTYDERKRPNLMNLAWDGSLSGKQLYLHLDKAHKTTANLKRTGAFTLSLAMTSKMDACDYLGMVSGFEEPDKVSLAGFHAEKSPLIDAPLIAELPLALECQVISYDENKEQLIGQLLNICCAEEMLTNGKIDIAKLQPLAFDTSFCTYFAAYSPLGFAYAHDLPPDTAK